ncbi:hypothetical protein K501DRAFT_266809 [Backusella circina FSU 941]|nr:hypothetical protein K501DRAFT_266809 [Backusella circina FSU 941]
MSDPSISHNVADINVPRQMFTQEVDKIVAEVTKCVRETQVEESDRRQERSDLPSEIYEELEEYSPTELQRLLNSHTASNTWELHHPAKNGSPLTKSLSHNTMMKHTNKDSPVVQQDSTIHVRTDLEVADEELMDLDQAVFYSEEAMDKANGINEDRTTTTTITTTITQHPALKIRQQQPPDTKC